MNTTRNTNDAAKAAPLCTECGEQPAIQMCENCDKHVCRDCRESAIWSTVPGLCAECDAETGESR